MDMKNMLALSINCYVNQGGAPNVSIGQGRTKVYIQAPTTVPDNAYWIVFLDVNNPQNKVKDFIIPGGSNSAVPAGLDAYMSNAQYIYVLMTKSLITYSVPQGDFFDYLGRLALDARRPARRFQFTYNGLLAICRTDAQRLTAFKACRFAIYGCRPAGKNEGPQQQTVAAIQFDSHDAMLRSPLLNRNMAVTALQLGWLDARQPEDVAIRGAWQQGKVKRLNFRGEGVAI